MRTGHEYPRGTATDRPNGTQRARPTYALRGGLASSGAVHLVASPLLAGLLRSPTFVSVQKSCSRFVNVRAEPTAPEKLSHPASALGSVALTFCVRA